MASRGSSTMANPDVRQPKVWPARAPRACARVPVCTEWQSRQSDRETVHARARARVCVHEPSAAAASLWRLGTAPVVCETARPRCATLTRRCVLGGVASQAAPLRRSLVAGALAGAVEATCTCPVETIKTRVQLARASATPQQARMLARGQLVQLSNPVLKATQTNMLLVGRDIVRAEGTLALWKGLRPLVGGVMIKKALRFGSFAWWKGAVTGGHGGPLSVGQSLLGGLFAGTIETVAIVTPSEVVKTRMQANTAVVRSSLVRAKVGSIAHVTGQIVRSEGPGALWNGLLPTWVRRKEILGTVTGEPLVPACVHGTRPPALLHAEQPPGEEGDGARCSCRHRMCLPPILLLLLTRVCARARVRVHVCACLPPSSYSCTHTHPSLVSLCVRARVLAQVRQSSNQAVRFAVVGEVAQRLKARDADDSKQGWHGFAAGGIAGGSSVLLNNPADVVKTRMMNQRNDLTSAWQSSGKTNPKMGRLLDHAVVSFTSCVPPRRPSVGAAETVRNERTRV